MSTPPIVTQYGGATPYKLTNVPTVARVFDSYFFPNQIPNLAVWLDGKDILINGSIPANGDPMSSWSNKAPNLIQVTQLINSNRPTFNSVSGVNFVNNSGLTILNGFNTDYSSQNTYETVFILFSNTASPQTYNLLYPTTSGGRQLYVGPSAVLTTAALSNGVLLESGTVTPGATTLISSWNSNGTIKHYINGLVTVSSNASPYTAGGNTLIGTDNYAQSDRFNGSISEIIIYSNVLSDTDRQKVESYLYWKWNTFVLDNGNPYKTVNYINYFYPTNVFYSYFYPTQISNLAIWLDGTDILNGSNPSNGSAITNWSNKAGNAITVYQSNVLYKPKFNSVTGGVDFVNVGATINGLTANYSSATSNETTFIVLDVKSRIKHNLLYPQSNAGRQLYLLSNSGNPDQPILSSGKLGDVDVLQSGTVKEGVLTLVTCLINKIDSGTTVINHYINGLLTGTSNTGPYITAENTTYIGTDNYLGFSGFNGNISEIIIYSNALSDSDRQKVESYLKWRWNITLDPSNPYNSERYLNSKYPNINSNVIPATPNNLYSGLPTLDSNNYPLIKNSIRLPNRLKNSMF